MKILLLGKDGQVGTELRRTLLPLGSVISIGRAEHNLEDLSGLSHLLNAHQPNIIVNAAAYNAVDQAESDEESAFLVNAKVPAVLAEYAKDNNALLIHYSTDYVFDGIKSGPYVETDCVNPQNVYGASKRAGEVAILQSGCPHLIFRTSWVFSSGGKNFVKTILELSKQRDNLQIVVDQYGAPTSAELVAEVTALAISSYQLNLSRFSYETDTKGKSAPLQDGIYHLTSTGLTTRHNLGWYIVDKALDMGMNLKLTRHQIHPIFANEYPLPAKRPENSMLDTTVLTDALDIQLPNWTVHVDRVINQLTQLEHSL